MPDDGNLTIQHIDRPIASDDDVGDVAEQILFGPVSGADAQLFDQGRHARMHGQARGANHGVRDLRSWFRRGDGRQEDQRQ